MQPQEPVTTTAVPEAIPEVGVLDTLKANFNPSNLMKKLNLTPNKIVEILIYFGAGILLGYFLKRYGKFVIILILTGIGLLLLHQLGIISIILNTAKLQEVFGMPAAPEGNVLILYWSWIKDNVALVLSLTIGFLVGLRIG